jgi:photosystem II stability/assembly factor-like uncharacterized protein
MRHRRSEGGFCRAGIGTWRARRAPVVRTLVICGFAALLCCGLAAAARPQAVAAASWHKQASGVTRPLTAVGFVDTGNLWIAGWDGLMLRTFDGGRHWGRMGRGSAKGYGCVAFGSTANGWAGGDGERIWGTSDGGVSWRQQYIGSEWGQMQSATAVDSLHAWVCGGSYMRGTIVATTDGGQSWQEQYSSDIYDIVDIDFVSATTGWAVGQWGDEGATNSVVLHTDDGGATWNVQRRWQSMTYGKGIYLNCVDFVDGRTGWISAYGAVFVTHDGGARWARKYSGKAQLGDIAAVGGSRVWITEGPYYSQRRSGRVLFSNNGGRTWTWQLSSNRKELTDIEFLDARHGWAVGRGGAVFAWY